MTRPAPGSPPPMVPLDKAVTNAIGRLCVDRIDGKLSIEEYGAELAALYELRKTLAALAAQQPEAETADVPLDGSDNCDVGNFSAAPVNTLTAPPVSYRQDAEAMTRAEAERRVIEAARKYRIAENEAMNRPREAVVAGRVLDEALAALDALSEGDLVE